jgi:hypothetical protein
MREWRLGRAVLRGPQHSTFLDFEAVLPKITCPNSGRFRLTKRTPNLYANDTDLFTVGISLDGRICL